MALGCLLLPSRVELACLFMAPLKVLSLPVVHQGDTREGWYFPACRRLAPPSVSSFWFYFIARTGWDQVGSRMAAWWRCTGVRTLLLTLSEAFELIYRAVKDELVNNICTHSYSHEHPKAFESFSDRALVSEGYCDVRHTLALFNLPILQWLWIMHIDADE